MAKATFIESVSWTRTCKPFGAPHFDVITVAEVYEYKGIRFTKEKSANVETMEFGRELYYVNGHASATTEKAIDYIEYLFFEGEDKIGTNTYI